MTSIAVVVLDTLRKDAFDRHFEWLPGRRFERAYSTANWTVPAHASLFTGRYSSEVGVHAKHFQFDCEEPALAERLRDAGYETRAYSANTNVTSHLAFDRGFTDFRTPEQFRHMEDDDRFDFRAFSRRTRRTGAAKYLAAVAECVRSDAATLPSLRAGLDLFLGDGNAVEYGGTAEAMAELSDFDLGEREFLYLNLMEAHEPLHAPDGYVDADHPEYCRAVGDRPIGDTDFEGFERAYEGCARYLADVYAELFERLRAEYDFVVTLSDHGELLGEGGAWGHEHGLQPALTHVPLVVSGEGFDGEPACEAPVSLLDVHATVLDLVGLDADGRGRSLVDVGEAGDAEYLTEYHGLTPWSRRELERNGHSEAVDRYDAPLTGYVGPTGCYAHETPDGLESTGCVDATDVEARMEALAGDRRVRRVEGDASVPEEIEEQLKHLGYA